MPEGLTILAVLVLWLVWSGIKAVFRALDRLMGGDGLSQ